MLIPNRSPISPFSQLHSQMNQMFNAMMDSTRLPAEAVARSAPPMNVWEQEKAFFIEAELPGYTMDDLRVSVLNDEITISGERKVQEVEGATYLRRERRGGSFTRTWTLPAEIDAERVEASLRDGVLLITLPKAEKALPRKIEVKVSGK